MESVGIILGDAEYTWTTVRAQNWSQQELNIPTTDVESSMYFICHWSNGSWICALCCRPPLAALGLPRANIGIAAEDGP